MAAGTSSYRAARTAPLFLRLGIAAICAVGAAQYFGYDVTIKADLPEVEQSVKPYNELEVAEPDLAVPGEAEAPVADDGTAADIEEAADAEIEAEVTAEVEADAAPVGETVVPSSIGETPEDDSFVMSWGTLIGYGQIAFGALLLIGLFVRFAALIPLIGVGLAVYVVNFGGSLPEMFAGLVRAYEANPTAGMFLGATCLALVIAGSGPVALDRLMHGRRAAAASSPNTTTA